MISTIDEDVSTAAGRSRYVARGAEILSHVSDGVIFDNCVKLLALESLSSLSTVREAVGKVDEVSDNFSLADPDDDVALAFVRKYLLLHSPASSMMARREKDKRPKKCPKSIPAKHATDLARGNSNSL